MVIGLTAAIIVGLIMGLMGAGGSILTLPILVYVMDTTPVTATAYSLFIVGVTSLFGSIFYWRKRLVNVKAAVAFSIPSVIVVFITRRFILPAIPTYIGTIGDLEITKDFCILILFAVVMAASAMTMILPFKRFSEKSNFNSLNNVNDSHSINHSINKDHSVVKISYPLSVLEGIFIGVFSGLVGAGGGFAIVPALVVFSNLPMRLAVGTSLTIIAAKSLVGFLGDLNHQTSFDWFILLMFTILSVGGMFAGIRISRLIPGENLRPLFGGFILTAAAIILVREILI